MSPPHHHHPKQKKKKKKQRIVCTLQTEPFPLACLFLDRSLRLLCASFFFFFSFERLLHRLQIRLESQSHMKTHFVTRSILQGFKSKQALASPRPPSPCLR